jgi:hypothetical protein
MQRSMCRAAWLRKMLPVLKHVVGVLLAKSSLDFTVQDVVYSLSFVAARHMQRRAQQLQQRRWRQQLPIQLYAAGCVVMFGCSTCSNLQRCCCICSRSVFR